MSYRLHKRHASAPSPARPQPAATAKVASLPSPIQQITLLRGGLGARSAILLHSPESAVDAAAACSFVSHLPFLLIIAKVTPTDPSTPAPHPPHPFSCWRAHTWPQLMCCSEAWPGTPALDAPVPRAPPALPPAGSVLIEQMLRNCNPSKIILIILPKKGVAPMTQVAKLLSRPLYNTVRAQYGSTEALLAK